MVYFREEKGSGLMVVPRKWLLHMVGDTGTCYYPPESFTNREIKQAIDEKDKPEPDTWRTFNIDLLYKKGGKGPKSSLV